LAGLFLGGKGVGAHCRRRAVAGAEGVSGCRKLVQAGALLVRPPPLVGARKSGPYFSGKFVLLFCCGRLILLTPCHCV
jgi:hypothetical protein